MILLQLLQRPMHLTPIFRPPAHPVPPSILPLVVPIDHIHIATINAQNFLLVTLQLFHIGIESLNLLLEFPVLETKELYLFVLALLDVVGEVLVGGAIDYGLARLV